VSEKTGAQRGYGTRSRFAGSRSRTRLTDRRET